MKLVVTPQSILDKREMAHKRSWNYLLSVTGSSTSMTDHFGMQYIASENKLSTQDLNFIQRVNAHITERLEKGIVRIPTKPEIKISMFAISPSKRIFTNISEVDLNSAYWRAAYLLGFIDLTIYNLPYSEREVRLTAEGALYAFEMFNSKKYYEVIDRAYHGNALFIQIKTNGGNKIVPVSGTIPKYRPSKEVRLIALGALAKKTEHFKYDGSDLLRTGIQKTDQRLIDTWEAICHHVHLLMNDIKNKLSEKEFVLYWVDAIVVDKSAREKVIELVKKASFDYKEKSPKRIIIEKNNIRVEDTNNRDQDRIFKT